MAYGPIELLVVGFPGNQFSGDITPALAELVESGQIRIIDVLFIQKDAEGNVTETELSDLVADVHDALEPLIAEVANLLTHDDALALATALAPNSSAGILLFENVWAKRFADAVLNAQGEVLINERIPRVVIDQLLAEYSDSVA